ncbi:OsmC family protein [soil metagenome]
MPGMQKGTVVRWQGALGFEAESEDGARIPLGGESTPAFGPAALMLAALAGCTGMDAISIMQKKRQRIERYDVEVSGEQLDEHPRAFTRIVVDHIIEGQGVDDVAVARAIELSARKYCVVGATIAAGDTVIQHRFRITDESGQRTGDCATVGPHRAGLAVRGAV